MKKREFNSIRREDYYMQINTLQIRASGSQLIYMQENISGSKEYSIKNDTKYLYFFHEIKTVNQAFY